MAGNDLSSLLEYMQKGSVCNEWGAISVFNKTRLNRVLEQQFIAQYDGSGYMPPFSGRVYVNDDETEYADLVDVVLGKPLLSFEDPASLDNSKVMLTLNIMAGTYTYSHKPAGAPETVLYSYKITEAQGYTLRVAIELSVVVGEVDYRGRVRLDLSNTDGIFMRCNLSGSSEAQKKLGRYFEERFKTLPRHRRAFDLGIIDFDAYNPLTPTSFAIRTQPAPGARMPGALNYGDGAVVVFIQTKSDEFAGTFPTDGSGFPFLIPDDQDSQGNDMYSCCLVLNHKHRALADNDRLALLNSLLFPGEHYFDEVSRHPPHDVVIFGNIEAEKTTIHINPLFKRIKAGQTHQFEALRNGRPLRGVTWSVRSLNTHGSSGTITPQGGFYQSVNVSLVGKETVRNVVTATYTDPLTKKQYRASSLLLVAFEAMTISPLVTTWSLSQKPAPITFIASTVSGANLTWSKPQYGDLKPSGNTAIYTPREGELPQSVVIDRIEVMDNDTGEVVQASVLLFSGQANLVVSPHYAQGLNRSGEIHLQANPSTAPTYPRTWTVIGDGTVDSAGNFKAPEKITNPISVVVCDIFYEGVSHYTGYSVIQLSDFKAETTWKSLSEFTIRSSRKSAYANGMQQMMVDVHVVTAAVEVEGQPVVFPLKPDEEASLHLALMTKQEVDFLDETQEGIEEGSSLLWATHLHPNRFDPYASTPSAATTAGVAPASSLLAFDKSVYVHTRAKPGENTRFVASIIGSNEQGHFYSHLHGGNGEVEDSNVVTLYPITLPEKDKSEYDFKSTRVAGGGAGGIGRPPEWPTLPVGEDDFDYHLYTTDYWRLSYRKFNQKALTFATCRFEGQTSLVLWESEYANEDMFSYTGYLFDDPEKMGDADKMSFDPVFDDRTSPVVNPVIVPGQPVVPGQLLISLFRTDKVRRSTAPELVALSDKIIAHLRDREGNMHTVHFGFIHQNRNKLYMEPII